MSTTPNQKDLLAKKSDLEGILKPDDNDVLHLPNVTITLAESGQFYLAGIDKKLLTLIGNTSGNAVTLDGDAGLTFTTSGGSSTITGITNSSGNSTSLAASQSMVSAKQDALTAGTNITISNNIISATDTNTLSDLTDTAISSLADGQVLKYNATSGKWVNGTGGGGAEVILGTTVPTAAQGSNGNLYIQYDDTNNNTVTHEYVKISGAWEEIAIGGGGGGGTSNFTETSLFTGGVSGTTTFTLSDNFNNYDYIAIYYSNSDSTTNYQDIKLYPSSLLNAHIGDSVNILGLANDAWYYYFTVTSTTQLTYAKSNAGWITDIIGLKYGSNGGGGGTGGGLTSTILLSTPITATGTYTLADSYTNYDLIGFRAGNGNNETDILLYTVKDISDAMGDSLTITNPVTNSWFNFTISGSSLVITGKTVDTIYSVIGYKVGGGGAAADEMTLSEYNALTTAQKNDGTIRFIPESNIGSSTAINMSYITKFKEANMDDIATSSSETTITWDGGVMIGNTYYYTTPIDVTDYDNIIFDLTAGSCYGGGSSAQQTRWNIQVGLMSVAPTTVLVIDATDSSWAVCKDFANSNTVYSDQELDVSELTGSYYLVINAHGWNATLENFILATVGGNPSQIKYMDKTYANNSGGGTTTTVSVTPKILTGINIADITVGNGNTTDIYDYAYFDGSGYYETPFKVDTDHEYEIIFEANYDATMAVIGTYAGANYFHLTIHNNYWYVGTNSGEVHPSAYTTGKHTFKTDSSYTYLDDTQFTSYTPAVVNNYITIGARENTYLYKGKFYEFKIKSISTGNILYDLVPGMRGTTKGLYDLISDTFVECSFISNMGTKTGTSGGVTTQLYAPSIEANPSGTATATLNKVEINNVIYDLPSGGGGGDASPDITLLNDGTITDGQYVLSEPISNFDEINFIIQYSNEYINSKNYYPKDLLRLSSSSTDPYGVTNFLIEDYGQRYLYCQYIDETHIKPLQIFSILKGIYGIKYKGGGDSSAMKLTQAEYDALTQEEKENGTIYFVGVTTTTSQLIPRATAADKTHITCSNEASGYPDWAAFNGIDSGGRRNPLSNTTWLAGDSETTPWIQYHFDEPYYLTKAELFIYSHYSNNGNGYQGNLYILGSNDGSTWTNISITGQPVTIDTGPSATSDSGSGLATVVQLDYDLNSSNQYEYIRFQGDEIWNKWGVISVDFDDIYVYGSSTPIVVEDHDIYYMGDKYTNNSGGASSHTYSTTEQVVGTWIDGRDMYEKTYYNATGPSQNHPITLDSNITTSNTDYFVCPQYSYLVGGSYINGGSFLEVSLASNGITVNSNNAPYGLGTITELYTTVRYVKPQPRNVSLLHFEGDLTDECGIGWYIEGSPTISTEQSKFGSSSLKFSGGFLYSDITPVFKFGNNDFTIDAWLYPTRTDRQAFFAIAPYSGDDHRLGIDMWQQGNSANQWMSSNGSSWNITNADGGGNGIGHIALSANTWQHIALVRNNTAFTLYVNGQVAVTNNIGTASVYWGSSDVFKLGNWGNHRYPFYGYIDEFRVANYAVWTDTFTPPTQPYT